MYIVVRSKPSERLPIWLSQFISWRKPEKLIVFVDDYVEDSRVSGVVRVLESLGWEVIFSRIVEGDNLSVKTGKVWRAISRLNDAVLFTDDDWFFTEESIRRAVRYLDESGEKVVFLSDKILLPTGGSIVVEYEARVKVPVANVSMLLSSGSVIDRGLWSCMLGQVEDMGDWFCLMRWFSERFSRLIFLRMGGVFHLRRFFEREYLESESVVGHITDFESRYSEFDVEVIEL